VIYNHDPKEFAAKSARYGVIGRTVVELSNLEFAHDQFILSVNKEWPSLASSLSSAFPRQFKAKTDFLVGAICAAPILRKQPIFGDGGLNLQWLQYQLDELYEVRAAIAHGSISYTETQGDSAVWRLDRVVQGARKGSWRTKSSMIGSEFMADVATTAHELRHYLSSLRDALEGRSDWESKYKSDCEIRGNHRKMKEEVSLGLYEPDPFMESLLSTYDED
jgi:hypothetical protein